MPSARRWWMTNTRALSEPGPPVTRQARHSGLRSSSRAHASSAAKSSSACPPASRTQKWFLRSKSGSSVVRASRTQWRPDQTLAEPGRLRKSIGQDGGELRAGCPRRWRQRQDRRDLHGHRPGVGGQDRQVIPPSLSTCPVSPEIPTRATESTVTHAARYSAARSRRDRAHPWPCRGDGRARRGWADRSSPRGQPHRPCDATVAFRGWPPVFRHTVIAGRSHAL